MNPQYHLAFCNVTFTEYAGVTYRDYYGSPAVMLETQLAAQDYAERRWGVGRFITPLVDSPSCALASYLGMSVIEPEDADELPYLDSSRPVLRGLADVDSLAPGDPRTSGLMAHRWEAWQYYRAQGYPVGFGGCGGEIMTLAGELSSGAALGWLAEDPAGAHCLLDKMVEVQETLASFGAALVGEEYHGFFYLGDDFAGLMSPAMYCRFMVPCYQRLYAGNERRFMHSELLRAEHLRISRDEIGITEFHGAGCKLLTLQEMYDLMGHRFWTQLTPQEMLELTPAQISDRVSELVQCGAGWLQLYPGRGTPEANMEAAVAAAQRECTGGPTWSI